MFREDINVLDTLEKYNFQNNKEKYNLNKNA